MNLNLRRIPVIVLAAVAGLALAACSAAGGTAQAPDAAADHAGHHNEADAAFLQMMIIHHQGAVEMSELALQKANSPEIKGLADRIATAQQPEIDRMTAWLDAWGEESDPAAMDHEGMNHGGAEHEGMDMDGATQAEAMDTLAGLEGPDFDVQFVRFMIAHHEGALVMAETVLADGVNPDVRALAEEITTAQADEIAEMEELAAQVG